MERQGKKKERCASGTNIESSKTDSKYRGIARDGVCPNEGQLAFCEQGGKALSSAVGLHGSVYCSKPRRKDSRRLGGSGRKGGLVIGSWIVR